MTNQLEVNNPDPLAPYAARIRQLGWDGPATVWICRYPTFSCWTAFLGEEQFSTPRPTTGTGSYYSWSELETDIRQWLSDQWQVERNPNAADPEFDPIAMGM